MKLYKIITIPASKLFGTVTNVITHEKIVALTFDDGPDPEYTPLLIQLLKKYNAFATFFMVGEKAKKYPEIVRLVAEAGHAIGVHSWNHMSFPNLSQSERLKQIRETARVLKPYGNKLFRPPYAHLDVSSRVIAFLLGYKVICWNRDYWDWFPVEKNKIAYRMISEVSPGDIILLHDSIYGSKMSEPCNDRRPVFEELDRFFKQINWSYKFVTIPDLIKRGNPVKVNWRREKREKELI